MKPESGFAVRAAVLAMACALAFLSGCAPGRATRAEGVSDTGFDLQGHRGARGLRVFWLCEEMGLEYRVETVSFPPSAAYLRLNPLGTVPFLEDEGGVAIQESIAMLLYLAQKYGPTPLNVSVDEPAYGSYLNWLFFGETTLTEAIDLMGNKAAAKRRRSS